MKCFGSPTASKWRGSLPMWQSACARSCPHGAHKCALRRVCGASGTRCMSLDSTTAAGRCRSRSRHIHRLGAGSCHARRRHRPRAAGRCGRHRHIHHLGSLRARRRHRPSWAADEGPYLLLQRVRDGFNVAADEGPYLILQRVSDTFNMLDEEFIKEKPHVFDFETVSWYGCNDF